MPIGNRAGAKVISTKAERLAAFRSVLRDRKLDGFLVPRSDEHLGENAPASSERLAWLTGFTGSAGLAVVLDEGAAVFSDGRYVLQLAAETDETLYGRHHGGETPPQDWLRARAREAGRTLVIGYDPRIMSEDDVERFGGTGVDLRAEDVNPVDAIWTDRPAPPELPARPHPERFAGRSSAAKRDEIGTALREAGQDAAVLTDPASIAWLLNIRGGDLETTPVALGFAIVHADAAVELFMDGRKLDASTREWLGNAVSVAQPDQMPSRLAALSGKTVRIDRAASPAWFAERLRAAGATVVAGADPILEPKARKNDAEIAGAREAHRLDGIAVSRFLHWLQEEATDETELSAVARLLAFRRANDDFRGESFPAIAGAGEHGAIMHYRVSESTDRAIRPGEFFLIDSGAQYACGTTDITRTVWIGHGFAPASLREQFTRVLKGMVALSTITFPEGVTGHRLDAIARAPLWRAGLDFDHGTGHGVGSVLGVHEGPVSISPVHRPVKVESGMIISNEPGYYQPGSHGIRIENLILARLEPTRPNQVKPFLGFETLTLAPIDRRCVEVALLDGDERAWLDSYHARVEREIGPALDGAARAWLGQACAPI